MRFSPEFIETVKNRVTLSTIVGQHVRLQKKGREWGGCCPFHKEKTPSFFVNDDKQFYHCFGCGAHGDAIKFLTELERMEFSDAIEKLAAMAGMALPAESRQEPTISRSEYDLLEKAADWFASQLNTTAGAAAREYLARRGIDGTTIKAFRIGFAPNSRDALKRYFSSTGVDEKSLISHGLLVVPENGGDTYDRFRARIIFPIADKRGRIIAFGGRIMGDGQPKYLNSPETPLFHKGHTLYNIHNARNESYRQRRLLIAEGYMDVIAFARAGIAAVAPLGTAVTEQHLEMCWNMADEPVFCMDGDAAGQRSMQRVAELALPHLVPGKSISFVSLAAGADPDSLFRSGGAEALQQAISKTTPLSEHLWQAALKNFGYGTASFTPERRAAMEKHLDDWCQAIKDQKVKSSYRDFFFNRKREVFSAKSVKKSAPARTSNSKAAEIECLALILNHPELLAEAGNEEIFAGFEFTATEHQVLQQSILRILPDIDSLTAYNMAAAFDSEATAIASVIKKNPLVKISAAIAPTAPPETARKAWQQCIKRLSSTTLKLDPAEMTSEEWEAYVIAKTGGSSA